MGTLSKTILFFAFLAIGMVVGGQMILNTFPLDQSLLQAGQGVPSSGPISQGSDDSIVDLERSHGVWVATVEFNDLYETKLIVDTGATFTTISENLAFDLGIPTRSPNQTINLMTAGGRVKAPMGVAKRVRVGNSGRDRVKVVIHTIPNLPEGVEGLLGLSFFDRFLVNLDHSKKQLFLSAKR